MDRTRKRIPLPTAIVIALALAPVLAACSSPTQGTVDQDTNNSAGPSNTVEPDNGSDANATALPNGFPKEVPVVPGEVVPGSGSVIDKSDGNVWSVTVQVNDVNAMDVIASQMEGAGFSSKVSSDSGSDSTAGAFDMSPYSVLVVVFKGDKGEFVANYTVTYKKPSS